MPSKLILYKVHLSELRRQSSFFQYLNEILNKGTFERDFGSRQEVVKLEETKGKLCCLSLKCMLQIELNIHNAQGH